MSTPGATIATRIATTVVSPTLAVGTNLFVEPLREPGRGHPQQCVYVLDNAGLPPEGYLAGNTGVEFYQPSVQVFVRSAPTGPDQDAGYATGLALARAVMASVHAAQLSGYIACRVRESQPIYVTVQADQSHIWSFNIDLMIEE